MGQVKVSLSLEFFQRPHLNLKRPPVSHAIGKQPCKGWPEVPVAVGLATTEVHGLAFASFGDLFVDLAEILA
jgi:hypothetical protein